MVHYKRYRRNSDEDLRQSERHFLETPTHENYAAYQAALRRIGVQPLQLRSGYSRAIPPGSAAAFGARTIVEHGGIGFVPGHGSTAGSAKDIAYLRTLMAGGLDKIIREEARRLIRTGQLRGDKAQELLLYADDEVVAIGNTNASHGYFYLVVFFRPNIYMLPPDIQGGNICAVCGLRRERNLLGECIQCHQLGCRDSLACAEECSYCEELQCSEHLKYEPPRCESCEELLCFSTQCQNERSIYTCQRCGRDYCYDCQPIGLHDCVCEDEEFCEYCNELIEECFICKEEHCVRCCEPCDEDEEDEEDEEEDD